MYLKQLRLHGFKSFADPTVLDLEPGVTAIVGPNGCGKSNIADALRWVLGEQSAKSLRAGAMTEVIFQGSAQRPPVNLCEVSLLFTDCEAQLGTAYREVEVTRRVTREGGSDYFLNGKRCRLKDIQRLFLDTGVGQVSYSFMLQGQIDQILSSNPQERRTIFEEAAGISKYKSQRREALAKLERVEENLARVRDVLAEVERQAASLKRQAAKALRFRRLRRRLTHLHLALSAWQYASLQGEVAELAQQAAKLQAAVQALAQALEQAEGEAARQRAQRVELNQQLQTAQQASYDLRSSLEALQGQASLAQARQVDAQKRRAALEHELDEMAAQEQIIEERLRGEHRARSEQMDLFGASDQQHQEQERRVQTAEKALQQAEAEVGKARQTLLVLENALTRQRSRSTTLEVELKTFEARRTLLREERHRLGEELQVLTQEAETLAGHARQRDEAKVRDEQLLEEARQERARLLESFRETQRKIQESGRAVAGTEAQIQTLENLQKQFEGFSEGAKALLKGQLTGVLDAAAVRPLLKDWKVESRWTKAVETALDAALEAVVLEDAQRLGPVAERLRQEGFGRAAVAVPAPTPRDWPARPDWLFPLAQAVRLTRPGGVGAEALLDGCYACDTLVAFLDWWREHPEADFRLVVTAEGEVLHRHGVVLIGRGKGKERDSLLARVQHLEALRTDLAQRKEADEAHRLSAENLQRQLTAAEKRVEERTARAQETAREVSTLQGQRQNQQRQLEQVRRQHEVKEQELGRLEQSHTASQERLQQAEAERLRTEKDLESARSGLTELEQRLQQARTQREAVREAFNAVRMEVAEKRQRLQLLERGVQELQARQRELGERRLRRRQEIDTLAEELERLAAEEATAEAKAADLQKTLEVTLGQVQSHREALARVDEVLQQVETRTSAQRRQHDEEAKALSQLEVRLARLQAQRDFLVEEVQREAQRELAGVDWRVELWEAGEELPERLHVDVEDENPLAREEQVPPPKPGELEALAPDWERVRAEVAALRTRIQSLGAVNENALEEYRELSEREQFLRTQSDDLWQSKEQLVGAINEINATSQKLFGETFVQIRTNFHYTFETLFGGGTSDLELIDNGDVLESGIEITAQPPGTRLKTLALLSGGQKTMTAVALLFAIYMVKPSPFCVLDEIDAPLDDANIGRFTGMLQRFLEYSQFLIITHNKRTISIANTLFGVTMQERGVSRLVSLRFNASTQQTEAAETAAERPVA